MADRPTTIFSGTTGPQGDRPGPDRVLTRLLAYVAVIVLFPIAALVYGIWISLFTYARLPWWAPTPAAALLTVLGLVTGKLGPGGVQDYINSVTTLFTTFGDGPVLAVLHYLAGHALIGAWAATCYAMIVCSWKWVRRPAWQERLVSPGPILKRRAKETAERIASGQDSPTGGITVGVAMDRRDHRFAGGKPGAKYGERVVISDSELAGHGLIVGASGSGKALWVETPIPTPTGFTRMGDLRPGHEVLGSDGLPVTVVQAHEVMTGHDCFDVVFCDGSSIVADAEHLWTVSVRDGDMLPSTLTLSTLGVRDLLDSAPAVKVKVVGRVPRGAVHEATGMAMGLGDRCFAQVRPVESVPVRCIAVDAQDRLFLAGEGFVPTHNTTTMLTGIRDVIRQGRGLVFVDCKGGPDVPQQVADWCARYGREFYHWTIQDPAVPYDGPADAPSFYDPLSRGDASRRKDLLIGSQRWDVEFYKTVIANYLQTLFAVKDLVPPLVGVDTFSDVADLLSPKQLLHRAQNIPAHLYPELAAALSRLTEMGEQEMSGIRNMYARLHTLTSSTAGAWLRRDPAGLRDINLRRVADEGHVVVFSLDTSNYEETATLLAGLIIQDLKTLSSELRNDPAPAPLHVYVDEFSAVDATNALGLISKARDASMPVLLATQALADLARREPTFVEQVLGIVSIFVIHRANTEADARIYAGLSGVTRKMLERMSLEQSSGLLGTFGAASATGAGYLEERDEYAINVGTFQNLARGQAVYIAKSPVARYVNPVQVVMEDEMAADRKGDPAIEVRIEPKMRAALQERETYLHPAATDPLDLLIPETRQVPAPAPSVPPSGPQRPPGPARPPANGAGPGGMGAPAGAPLPSLSPAPGKPAGTPMPPSGSPPQPPPPVPRTGTHSDEWMMP